MKRKTLLIILSLVCALCCVFGLAACGDEHGDIPAKPHEHSYMWIHDGDGYEHVAWCKDPECTDPYGEREKHEWNDKGICKICGADGYELGTYEQPHEHVFDREWDTDEYLVAQATCTTKAEYYYSCECGEKGKETFKLENSDYGDHSYENGVCEFCGATEGLEYYAYNDVSIVIGIGTATGADIVIASTYNGLPVTSIQSNAFDSCNGLTSITIPDSVTRIGNNAFGNCSNLTDVTIPKSVTSIESNAFYGCTGLTGITIPDGVTSIEGYAFGGCSNLTSITVSDGNAKYHSVGNCLIETASKTLITGCKTSVIPTDGSVTGIGYGAFDGCSGLTEIDIPDSVASIGSSAFAYCGLTSVTIPDSVTSIGSSAFAYCGLSSVTIPESVTSIGGYAFENCDKLSSVTLGSGTADVDIGSYAFENCQSLKNLTINGIPASIGNYAFRGCPVETAKIPESVANYIGKAKLKSLTVTTGVSDSAFSGCAALQSVTVDGSIGINAFKDCAELTSATVGGRSVDESAFSGCGKLSSVTFDGDIESIGQSAFSGCVGLTEITIPNSVTELRDFVFTDCTALTKITIGNGVTNIFPHLFNGCDSLTHISVYDNNRYYSTQNIDTTRGAALYSKDKTQLIIVPKGLLATFVIPDGVTTIGDDAFYDCGKITRVEIPDSVSEIKGVNDPFLHCDSLSSVSVNKNNSSYCSVDGILYDKAQTKIISVPNKISGKISIPNGVTEIYSRMFEGRNLLTEIKLPDSITLISGSAFKDCTGLTEITIPEGVTTISAEAFGGCSRLMIYCEAESQPSNWHSDWNSSSCPVIWDSKNNDRDINGDRYAVIDGVRYQFVSGSLFAIVNKVISASEEMTIPSSVTYNDTEYSVESIGLNAFKDCTELKSVTLSNGVSRIWNYAFWGCTNLTRITIPDSVTGVGNSVFYHCSNLNIYYEGDIASWCAHALGQLTGGGAISKKLYINDVEITGELIIPNGVTQIPSYAFLGCTDLTSIILPSSVTYIGFDSFAGCTNLASITVDGDNEYYFSQDGILYAIYDDGTSIEFEHIPQAITGEIAIPNGITQTYGYLFENRTNLTSITIPSSVTVLGSIAFSGCTNLASITVDSGNANFSSQDGILYDKAKTEILYVPLGITGDVIIPDTVTAIGWSAFKDRVCLTSITIPNSVTGIGSNAFEGCNNLIIYCEAESQPSNWHYEWNYSYSPVIWDCKNNDKDENGYAYTVADGIRYQLTDGKATVYQPISVSGDITIPARVTYNDTEYVVTGIRSQAFRGCTGLTGITIPASVTSIENDLFSGCNDLTSITFQGTKEQWNAIEKDDYWDLSIGDYTVHCSDGDIAES